MGKEYNDTVDVIKIQNICISKDTIKKTKRQVIEREKIYVNYICDLYPEYIKYSYNSLIRRQKTQLKNGQRSEWTFHQSRYMNGQYAHEMILNIISH